MAGERKPNAEYKPDAIFVCGHCGLKSRRDRCITFRGSLCCPSCRMRWSLQYIGRRTLGDRHD